MTSISSVASLILDLPPSCIAFCPAQPQYFVVGTYLLHEQQQDQQRAPINHSVDTHASSNSHDDDDTTSGSGSASLTMDDRQAQGQKRSGSLILFRLEGNTITQLVTKQTDCAILDLQWTPHNERLGDLLAVSTSTGLLNFYRLDTSGGSGDLLLLSSKAVVEPGVLNLSLAWHPRHAHAIGLTCSNGSVCICESKEGEPWSEEAVVHLTEIHQHELEAWCIAFSGSDSTSVLSGGDDVALQCSRINEEEGPSMLWKDRRLHQAGVTAILPLNPDLAVTGSYDDHIRLVSLASDSIRRVLVEHNLGGGVWRLKVLARSSLPVAEAAEPNPDVSDPKSLVLLASCMHAGSCVVSLRWDGDGGMWSFDVVARFEEHRSMNYGSDVQPSSGTTKSIVSTSFYDKLLCLWHFDLGGIDHAAN